MFLNCAFIGLVAIITAYMIRHYIFTLAAIYHKKQPPKAGSNQTVYEPKVSVLIPAHNEEDVIERILQRMKELTSKIISETTGKSIEMVKKDTERDNFMTAEEAMEYGLIDRVFVEGER